MGSSSRRYLYRHQAADHFYELPESNFLLVSLKIIEAIKKVYQVFNLKLSFFEDVRVLEL